MKPDRYNRFLITRRKLLNNPTSLRQARYTTYDSILVCAEPITVREAWAREQNMAMNLACFPIGIQPLPWNPAGNPVEVAA